MPFNETPGKEHQDISARSGESESSTSREREKAEERKQEALRYLVDTGRVTTPEEAEQYLESLHRLKERIVAIIRETVTGLPSSASTPSQHPDFFLAATEGSQLLRHPIDSALQTEELDRTDPHVWLAQCTVAPAVLGSMVVFEDALLLAMRGDRKVGVRSGGWLLSERLNSNLSPGERKLLRREHELTRKELVEKLRTTAKQWKHIKDEHWEHLYGRPTEEE